MVGIAIAFALQQHCPESLPRTRADVQTLRPPRGEISGRIPPGLPDDASFDGFRFVGHGI